MIITNHIGFDRHDPLKRAAMPVDGRPLGFLGERTLQIVNVGELIRHPLDSPAWLACQHVRSATEMDSPWGRWAVCDFDDIAAIGGYQAQAGEERSYPFVILDRPWRRLPRLLMEWYRIAACGQAAAGYHPACHLDDCQLDDGRQVDLVGGWHDAGDLRKWTSTMAIVTESLAVLAQEHHDRLGRFDLVVPAAFDAT